MNLCTYTEKFKKILDFIAFILYNFYYSFCVRTQQFKKTQEICQELFKKLLIVMQNLTD